MANKKVSEIVDILRHHGNEEQMYAVSVAFAAMDLYRTTLPDKFKMEFGTAGVETAEAYGRHADTNTHAVDCTGEFCSCGQDLVTCQMCGFRICGTQVEWRTPVPGKQFNGNVCKRCLAAQEGGRQ